MKIKYQKYVSEYDGKRFLIEEDLPGIGFYVYVYDENGGCVADYLQDTLKFAKECVEEDFGVSLNSWNRIE